MASAKDIVVKPISSTDANRVVRQFHYSGKVVNNSQLHFGVLLNGKCGGAMSFGPPLDRRKLLPLVTGTKWNEMMELNRMAFGDLLPRNSESRALSVAFCIIRKNYPHVQWVVSFADGAQCGDGTIYRAAVFVLTAINKNNQIWEAPAGETFSRTSLTDGRSKQQQQQATRLCRVSATKGRDIIVGSCGRSHETTQSGGGASMKRYIEAGFKPIPGFQLRYVYFLDPTARERLIVPILPFSEIERRGAGMYMGQPRTRAGSDTLDTPAIHAGEGGSIPTPALQSHDLAKAG